MAMITPLSETGNVLSLKHSSHIFICCFIGFFINVGAKLQKDCLAMENNAYFCGLQAIIRLV
jgi:hypothetical protein